MQISYGFLIVAAILLVVAGYYFWRQRLWRTIALVLASLLMIDLALFATALIR